MELTLEGRDSPCHQSCCGVSARRSASELFERGFRRSRLQPYPLRGACISDSNGLSARFSLRIAEGCIRDVRFAASSCATLVAYCELVAEITSGLTFAQAAQIDAASLAAELTGVPLMKRDRAVLAVNAFRSALAHAFNLESAAEAAA